MRGAQRKSTESTLKLSEADAYLDASHPEFVCSLDSKESILVRHRQDLLDGLAGIVNEAWKS